MVGVRSLPILLCLASATAALAQGGSACLAAYGIEAETGVLYRIDLAGDFGRARDPVAVATPDPSLGVSDPDALARDDRTGRLYFTGADGAGGSWLFGYDPAANVFWRAGPLHGRIEAATFLNGSYHFVVQGTEELRKAFLTREGTVFAETSVARFGLGAGLLVEDLASHDGVLYGSTRSDGAGPSARLFAYHPERAAFETLSTRSGTFLQLTFANDRGLPTLFGASRDDGVFYEIDHLPWGDGATTRRFTFPETRFADLAPASCRDRSNDVRNDPPPERTWPTLTPVGTLHGPDERSIMSDRDRSGQDRPTTGYPGDPTVDPTVDATAPTRPLAEPTGNEVRAEDLAPDATALGAEMGEARLGGIAGVGTLQVVRDGTGRRIHFEGTWRPFEEGTDVSSLDENFEVGSPMRYEGRLHDPADAANDTCSVDVVITSRSAYSYDATDEDDGRRLALFNFRPVEGWEPA